MNFNTLLCRFGLDPNSFDNRYFEPIEFDSGYIYEVYQKDKDRKCPYCGSTNCEINNYSFIEIKATINTHLKEILRIRKIRYKCKYCHKTFTNPIDKIEPKSRITSQVLSMINSDFYRMLTFSEIANTYNITVPRVLQLFDKTFNFVPRKYLPSVLCIDEKHFKDEDSNYCCILYDYINKDVVDVIKDRKLAYLDEYFSKISEKERDNVKFFVTDMYDAYYTIYRRYFNKATHLIDLYHVVEQLTKATNTLRIQAMNRTTKGTLRYKFFKEQWRQFLRRKEDIPDQFYTDDTTGEIFHYDDLLFECLKYDNELAIGYNILQDFYHYHQKRNFTEALEFINYIIHRLYDSNIDQLIPAADTFCKWKIGIANTISRSQNTIHYSNSIAEVNNRHIDTLINISYGYRNFERFRKRILLIRTYSKQ